MKKILFLALIAVFCGAFSVSAYAEEFYDERELLKTYVSGEVSLMDEDADKAFEEKIVAGLKNLDAEIDVSEFGIPAGTEEEKEKFRNAYYNVLYNNPELYYVKTELGWSVSEEKITKIKPKYKTTDTAEVAQMTAQISAATDEILLLINGNMTEFDKVMTVHDYMVLNYQYDTVGLENANPNFDTSIMVTKTGVCQAYALAFKHVMNSIGIDCLFVASDSMQHAWNLVKVDGKWYHIDLTWDDPVADRYAQVQHTYALLSSAAIENMPEPYSNHNGFDLGEITADSDKYDSAPWRTNSGAVVYCMGKTYYVNGDELVTADGDVICEKLSGDGKWDLGGGMSTASTYAGAAEYNGKLYFNTDTAIMVYNPLTKETAAVESIQGIAGLFIRNNTLGYGILSVGDGGILEFVKGGELLLGDVKIGETYFDANTAVTRVYTENDAVLNVFAADGEDFDVVMCGAGVNEVRMDCNDTLTMFFWNELLKPYREKLVINK